MAKPKTVERFGDETPETHFMAPVAPHSTAVDPELPPPWNPKPGPSARELNYHAIRTQLLSIRQQVESVLAQLAAMEAGPAASATDPRVSARGSTEEARNNVFGRIRERQRGTTEEARG